MKEKTNKYKVAEIFTSINGEGIKAGQLAVFVRFAGCNMACNYCDTMWANEKDAEYELMTEEEIYKRIKQTGIRNVTITGGEPLYREGIKEFLTLLAGDESLEAEIETNGGVDLTDFAGIVNRPSFTMDYKLPGSGMEKAMKLGNFDVLDMRDTVKFVVSNEQDLIKTKELIEKYNLADRCNCIISPVFGRIEPVEIVEFMQRNCMNKIRMQLQLHKIIWDPQQKGV